MQSFAGVSHQLRETRFDVHVHVFELDRPDEIAALNLATDLIQPLQDCLHVGVTDDAAGTQHRGMGS